VDSDSATVAERAAQDCSCQANAAARERPRRMPTRVLIRMENGTLPAAPAHG
jgi:hypothetical protein